MITIVYGICMTAVIVVIIPTYMFHIAKMITFGVLTAKMHFTERSKNGETEIRKN